jgi:hypothetical protein
MVPCMLGTLSRLPELTPMHGLSECRVIMFFGLGRGTGLVNRCLELANVWLEATRSLHRVLREVDGVPEETELKNSLIHSTWLNTILMKGA